MSRAAPRSVYQIDFTAVACGKRVASSKRRVRWRFGFANIQALAAGMTGTDCRGDEHDVTFVWSLSSGKRTVLFDGQEVHYSSSRSGIFDYSWTMRGTSHVLKIVAHATPPMSTAPGFRQYDLFIDGQSFFRLPKVFRLGLTSGTNDPRASAAMARNHSHATRGSRRNNPDEIIEAEIPSNPDEEEAYLQEAIRQSLEKDAKAVAATTTDLLSFDALPSPPSHMIPSAYRANNLLFDGNPQQQMVMQYQTAYPGSEDSFGYAQQAPLAAQSMSTSTNPPFPATELWEITTPPPAIDPGQQPPYQVESGAQQAFTNQSVPASSAATPYVGASVATYSNGFARPMNETAVQPFPQQAHTVDGYHKQQQHQPPAPIVNHSYGGSGVGPTTQLSGYAMSNQSSSQWTPPPPIVTTGGYGMPSAYAKTQQQTSDVPLAVTPQAIATPSTLGFGSPEANFAGFGSPAPGGNPAQFEGEERAPGGEQQSRPMRATDLFGGNAGDINGQPTGEKQPISLVNQAYLKLVDFESFSISSKNDAPRTNPFETSPSVGGTKSLADIQATKAVRISMIVSLDIRRLILTIPPRIYAAALRTAKGSDEDSSSCSGNDNSSASELCANTTPAPSRIRSTASCLCPATHGATSRAAAVSIWTSTGS
ncbi:hypothetical protein MPSEU_000470100 [Mayamaea pseudoterrestris]|nr:hypothetical protein MPSEU_000470100 [Mayamaea pseudoterrestris]